jgi:NhaP-type Na+/H+ or K+/H+ antiporter
VDEGLLLLILGGILAASIVVAFGATRAGVPSLVAFLGLGMLLGSDGLGGIEFDDADLARKVGVVALAAILFEGGLATSWRRLREVAFPATMLTTVGVLVTTLLTGLAVRHLRPLLAAVGAARRRRLVDRRCSRVRDPAFQAHRPTPRPDTRGGDRRERPMAIASTIGLID